MIASRVAAAIVPIAMLLGLGACTSDSDGPGTTPPTTSAVVRPATSPEEAALRWFAAARREDFDTARALQCEHGWKGSEGFQLATPGGPYTLAASARRTAEGWDVRVTAASRDGSARSTSSPFVVVRRDGRYLVCGAHR